MKFESHFTVAQPMDRVWAGLLDIPRVAACLPGAKLDAANGDGTHHGTIEMRIGAMKLSFAGSARLADVDEDARVASIALKAREHGGGSTASATIRNRVEGAGPSASRVTAETDLRLSGRVAQMGGGMIEEIASNLLDEFARRFERALIEEPASASPLIDGLADQPVPTPQSLPPSSGDDEPFELGEVLLPIFARRGLFAVAGLAVLALLAALLGRRRRSVRFTVEHDELTVKLERRW